MKDDTPDYSRYSLEELYDIARRAENILFSRQYRRVMKEIEKREYAALPPTSRSLRTLWLWIKWIAIIVFLVLLVGIGEPFYSRSKRPAWERFTAAQTFARKMNAGDIAKLRSYTRQFVVAEGPCNGGCQGGIVPAADVQELILEWRLKDSGTSVVIWLAQIQPHVFRRRNDLWGEDELIVHGKPMEVETIYFAVVPGTLVRARLQWIKVDVSVIDSKTGEVMHDGG